MQRVGVVGIGEMGIGLAANLIGAGYQVTGFDLRPERRARLEELGGTAATSVREVAARCEAVFIMVLSGAQVQAVVVELLEELPAGATMVVTATITPAEVRGLLPLIEAKQVNLIDCPVSGGKPGADAGTLTRWWRRRRRWWRPTAVCWRRSAAICATSASGSATGRP